MNLKSFKKTRGKAEAPALRKRRVLKCQASKKKGAGSKKRASGEPALAEAKKGKKSKATPAQEAHDAWDDGADWDAQDYWAGVEWDEEGDWAAWYGEDLDAWERDWGVAAAPTGRKSKTKAAGKEWATWDKDSGVAATPAGRKPKTKAAPKATAKAKAKAKAKAAPKSSPKAKAKGKAKASKNAEDSHPRKSLKETKDSKSYDNINEYQVDQAKQAIMAYAEKYVGRKYKPALKKELRSDAGPRLTNSGLNIYWTKCGCGVSCKTVSKDTGYFYFRGQGVSYLLRLCVAIKAAYLLVVHPHFRRHVIELEVYRVG